MVNSLAVFWGATGGLSILTLPFLWPFLKKRVHCSFFILSMVLTIGISYFLYGVWGSATNLKNYYSEAQYEHRKKQASMRPLLVQFRKAEQRYLLRVENNPKDREAWLNLAQIYLIQQDEIRAAAAFKQAKAAAEE
jgi:cytochrome c-type biogenesis protein CcmH/NrfG